MIKAFFGDCYLDGQYQVLLVLDSTPEAIGSAVFITDGQSYSTTQNGYTNIFIFANLAANKNAVSLRLASDLMQASDVLSKELEELSLNVFI